MIERYRKIVVTLVCCVGVVGYVQPSIYGQAKDYTKSYLPFGSGQTVLTADSLQINQQIQDVMAPGNWAINQRVGSAGFLRPFIGTGLTVNVSGMIVQSDSSLVVVGYASSGFGTILQGFVMRFLSNGVLDSTFAGGSGLLLFSCPGDGGQTTTQCISPDGAGGYYVGGYTGNGVQGIIGRVTSAGVIDTTFGTSGFLQPAGTYVVSGIALQSTGAAVYVAATVDLNANGFLVNRLTSAGLPDSSFTTYTAAAMHAYALAIDSQNRIIVSGTNAAGNTIYVYRVNQNGGAVDPTFNNGTFYSTAGQAYGGALALLPDDSIVIVGRSGFIFGIYKLTSAGVPDTSFGNGTGAVSYQPVTGGANLAQGVVLVPGGRIAVVGQGFSGAANSYCTLLLNSDGSLNQYFSISGEPSAVGAGGANVQIPAGTTTYAQRVGYQGTISSTGLVVAGTSSTSSFGMIFYTDLGAGV